MYNYNTDIIRLTIYLAYIYNRDNTYNTYVHIPIPIFVEDPLAIGIRYALRVFISYILLLLYYIINIYFGDGCVWLGAHK